MTVNSSRNHLKLLVVLIFAVLVAAYFHFDLGRFLSLDYLKSEQVALNASYNESQLLWLSAYFIIYTVMAAASLPGATILTLAGGALFGLPIGLLVVSFASSIGATLAFLSARFLFRDAVQNRFGENLKKINEGFTEDGKFYLLSLRLIPAFPFFMVNLLMGLTPIRTFEYYLISQIGMLPGTFVYVNAGTQLSKIDSLQGILSLDLILSFALLGAFPLIVKKTVQYLKSSKRLT